MLLTALLAPVWVGASTEYTLDGSPTSLEEEIRWLLNRGRYDSAAENAARGTGYSDIPASSGPLAPHASLILAARHHSEDLAVNDIDPQHVNPHATVPASTHYNSSTHPYIEDRMKAEGYTFWQYAAENIGAGNLTPTEVYVGLWNSTSHRQNMYDAVFSEIGVGRFENIASAYRYYYTMDLGHRWVSRLFTGTLFHDADGDGSYNDGEGLGGIEVRLEVNGVPTAWHDVSEAAGSFAIPIDDVPLNTPALVKLRNTTASPATCSIPLSYDDYAEVGLAAGETVELGTFTRPPESIGIGFRDLSPVAPAAAMAASAGEPTVTWPSHTFLEYQVESSTNLVHWVPASDTFTPGTGSPMSHTDGGSGTKAYGFYRLNARWKQ